MLLRCGSTGKVPCMLISCSRWPCGRDERSGSGATRNAHKVNRLHRLILGVEPAWIRCSDNDVGIVKGNHAKSQVEKALAVHIPRVVLYVDATVRLASEARRGFRVQKLRNEVLCGGRYPRWRDEVVPDNIFHHNILSSLRHIFKRSVTREHLV